MCNAAGRTSIQHVIDWKQWTFFLSLDYGPNVSEVKVIVVLLQGNTVASSRLIYWMSWIALLRTFYLLLTAVPSPSRFPPFSFIDHDKLLPQISIWPKILLAAAAAGCLNVHFIIVVDMIWGRVPGSRLDCHRYSTHAASACRLYIVWNVPAPSPRGQACTLPVLISVTLVDGYEIQFT